MAIDGNIKLIRTDESDEKFLSLVGELDAELRVRDGEDHDFYAQFNKPKGLRGVVLAYADNEAVGCGAFKEFTESTAEIKRMFVRPQVRGKRIATAVLAELERWAAEKGFAECVLETGYNQPEAIALYRRSGYTVIPNYGQYVGVENSICMTRSLSALETLEEDDRNS